MDKPLWGLRVLKFDGAIAPKVLRFDSGSAAEGCGGRLTFIEGASLYKTIQPPCGRGNAIPLWWLAPLPFRPAGKRVTGFLAAYGSLRIQFPCHLFEGVL